MKFTMTIVPAALLSVGASLGAHGYMKVLAMMGKLPINKRIICSLLLYAGFIAFIFGEIWLLDLIIRRVALSWGRYLVPLPFVFGCGYLFINFKKLRAIEKSIGAS